MRHLFIIVLTVTCLLGMGNAQVLPNPDHGQQQQPPAANRPFRKGNAVPDRMKKMQEIRAAYITKKLDLTPAQAEKFWPVYNQYQVEMFNVQYQIRLNNSPAQSNGADQVQTAMVLEQKRVNIKMHYNTEFQKILPIDKVSLIYKSEREFQDEAIRTFREKRNQVDN